MRLFEAAFYKKWQPYQRVWDTELGRTVVEPITVPSEWYVPRSKGIYTSVIDPTVTLEKKQGRAKDGREEYGFLNPIYRTIRDEYWEKDAYNKSPRIWYLDIETRVGTNSTGFPVPTKAEEPISLFQIYDNKAETMIILGLKPWKHQDTYEFPYRVKYILCTDEKQMIETYLTIFEKLDPLIIYAWNATNFDFPYLFHRLKGLGIDPNRLSNHGDVGMASPPVRQGNSDPTRTGWSPSPKFKAAGHFYLDLMEVYKKFTFKPVPSYGLDTIAEFELGQRKVQHSEYAAFDDFYTGKYLIPDDPTPEQEASAIYKAAIRGDWDEVRELAHSEFVYYGAQDTYLIKLIDDKKDFTALMSMISEKMGVQFADSLGTVKPWSHYILNRSMLNRQVMPPTQDQTPESILGGHVRQPDRGKHRWVLSADVNSMYPLLGMVGFNMSPETFVPRSELPADLKMLVQQHFGTQEEGHVFDLSPEQWTDITETLRRHNMALAVNGAVFRRDEIGMIPVMVQEIYDSRKKAKGTQFRYEKKSLEIQEILNQRKTN